MSRLHEARSRAEDKDMTIDGTVVEEIRITKYTHTCCSVLFMESYTHCLVPSPVQSIAYTARSQKRHCFSLFICKQPSPVQRPIAVIKASICTSAQTPEPLVFGAASHNCAPIPSRTACRVEESTRHCLPSAPASLSLSYPPTSIRIAHPATIKLSSSAEPTH